MKHQPSESEAHTDPLSEQIKQLRAAYADRVNQISSQGSLEQAGQGKVYAQASDALSLCLALWPALSDPGNRACLTIVIDHLKQRATIHRQCAERPPSNPSRQQDYQTRWRPLAAACATCLTHIADEIAQTITRDSQEQERA